MKQRISGALRDILAQHLAALALCDEPAPPLPPLSVAAILGLHLLGLAAVWRYFHQPIWLALPTLLLLAALPLAAWRCRRAFALETLAPFGFLYALLLARFVAIRVLHATQPYQDEASLADVRLIFFQVEVAAVAAIAYTLLVQITRLVRDKVKLCRLILLLAIAALVWFAAETIGHRTRGVTGSDPYAYAQMAVDLATHGTPLHRFTIFPSIVPLEVTWYPVLHVGYRLPINLSGDAATVWPIGGSVWLALAYRVLGEEGLYLATPLAALASLIAFAWLAGEYFRDTPIIERAAIAATCVALLATSWEQVDRSLVPFVDAQTQLFSILAIGLTLRAMRARRVWIWGALAGLTLGAAYFVRHTQVLLAVPIVIGAWQMPMRERSRFLAAATVTASLIALPDLYYHRQYLGGWLTPESNELALFSLSNVLPSTAALSGRFLATNEFGYLVPFLLYGTYRAAREDARKFFVLASWLLLLVAFHLPYAAVRMRDLLPEFPVVILWAAYGMIALARDLRAWSGVIPWRRGVVALAIFLALLLSVRRTQFTFLRPFQPVRVTFGYVTESQRAAFDQIAALTPRDAVIGSAMNDGPIDLYAQRVTVRLGAWNPAERALFIAAMRRENRVVYLLDDGAETSAARRDLATRYTLRRVAVLDVPLFGAVDGTSGALWEIIAEE